MNRGKLGASIYAAGVLAALAVWLVPQAASSQQVIKLTIISGFPPQLSFNASILDTWIPEVDRRLMKSGKYKIQWNVALSGQIAKPGGELDAIEKGLGDIGIVNTPIYADKLPLMVLPYAVPFTIYDQYVSIEIMAELHRLFPKAFDKMWGDWNQKMLVLLAGPDDFVMFTNKPVKRLSDVQGFKIGAAGPLVNVANAAGMVGVSNNAAESYNGIQTGIYGGQIIWRDVAAAFRICEVAPYITNIGVGVGSSVVITANLDIWKKLPEEVKGAMLTAGPLTTLQQMRKTRLGEINGAKKCATYGGGEATLPDEDRAEWAKRLPNLAKQWVKTVEAKGYPGMDILEFYMAAARNAQVTFNIPRQWDKEAK